MNGPRVSPQRPERDTRRVSDQTGWPTIECIRTGRDLNARTASNLHVPSGVLWDIQDTFVDRSSLGVYGRPHDGGDQEI